VSPTPRRPSDEQLALGRSVIEQFTGSREWIHRRVETVAFQDHTSIRRRVSVDFTPPAEVLATVPIALLEKRPLVHFDLRDEAGASVPLLGRDQNAVFAAAGIAALLEDLTHDPVSDFMWVRLCEVTAAAPDDARDAVREIAKDPSNEAATAWGNGRIRALLATLADNFLVLVPLDKPVRRRVLKYAYDQRVQRLRRPLTLGPPLRRLATALGWRGLNSWFGLPDLGSAASYHFEIGPGEGLEAAGEVRAQTSGEPMGHAEREFVARAHLYVDGSQIGTRAFARVVLRVRREGLLRGAPWIGLSSAAVLTLAWFGLPDIASRDVAPLILVVPSVLAAYIGRPGEHPLVSQLLLPARALLLSSGLLSFAGAAALAANPSVSTLRWALGAAAVLAWITFYLLIETAMRPALPEDDPTGS
jgi:hypothetical protein